MFGRQVKSLERLRDDLPDRVVDALIEAFGHNEGVLEHQGALVLNRGTRPEAERAEYGEFYLGEGAEARFVGRAIGVPKWGKTVAPWIWRINPRNGRLEYLVEVRESIDWQGLILQGTTVPVYLCVTGDNQPDVNVGDTIWFVFDPKGNRVAVPSTKSFTGTSASGSDPSHSSSESSSVWSDPSFPTSDPDPSDPSLPSDPSYSEPPTWPPDPQPSFPYPPTDPPPWPPWPPPEDPPPYPPPPGSYDPTYPDPSDPSNSLPSATNELTGDCMCGLAVNTSTVTGGGDQFQTGLSAYWPGVPFWDPVVAVVTSVPALEWTEVSPIVRNAQWVTGINYALRGNNVMESVTVQYTFSDGHICSRTLYLNGTTGLWHY